MSLYLFGIGVAVMATLFFVFIRTLKKNGSLKERIEILEKENEILKKQRDVRINNVDDAIKLHNENRE